MLISFLLNVANFLGELLNGVLVCAVLHLKVWNHFSVLCSPVASEGETYLAAFSQLPLVSP